ncbi:MAG: hypothetical protein Ct9H300mP9_3550 [Candidatus Neomarinimicrobiota bacterium]|nr:MAG: hypothetical protein Ct9H300mP9_3550 [Candidatus Neomarinimicrobiota bacterium]
MGSGPHPVVVYIHGGPESQFRPSFSSRIQYWVKELGVAVLATNVRGSSGFGKTYVQMDNGYKREDSVKDIGAFLDWISEQSDLDQERVSVFGGSYGGYMVLASMTHYNERLRCAIDVVGISNFVSFLRNTESYRRDLRRGNMEMSGILICAYIWKEYPLIIMPRRSPSPFSLSKAIMTPGYP